MCSIVFGIALLSSLNLQTPKAPTHTRVENEHIALSFARSEKNYVWAGFTDKKRNIDLIAGSSAMFRIDFLNAQGQKQSLFAHSQWDRVEELREGDDLVVRFFSEAFGTLNLRVGLREEEVVWSLDVDTKLTLLETHFPMLEVAPIADNLEDDKVFFPEFFGKLQAAKDANIKVPFPAGRTNLSLSGIYDDQGGVALFDTETGLNPRTIHITPMKYPTHSRTLFEMIWKDSQRAIPKQSMRIIGGDWFDAASVYRERVRIKAPERFARSIDPRINDTAFWISDNCVSESNCDDIIAFQKELGLPITFHWYNWHQIKFDDNYPAFLPARPGFGETVARLQASNVRVMPYINANLWDSKREDFSLEDAVLDRNGKPNVFEASGLAQICPSSERFRNTLAEVTRVLQDDYHVDGIYLDQLSAVQAPDCHNPAHHHENDHPLSWLEDGNYLRVAAIEQSSALHRPFITSEWGNEAYVGRMDAALANNIVWDDPIPLFAAVYNDAIRTFGRFHWVGPDVEKAYLMKLGQSLVYGAQPGWIDMRLLKMPKIREWSIRFAKLRYEYREYFDGRMLRPPTIKGTLGTVTADWYHYWRSRNVSLPEVMTGAFSSKSGEAISVFVNIGETPKQIICGKETLVLEPAVPVILHAHISNCSIP